MTDNRTRYSGAKLSTILKAQGRRLDWLAEQMGVSPSFLSRQMSGKKRINRTHALKAANALQIPVHWLADDAPTSDSSPPEPLGEEADHVAGRSQ